jgi:hypothetical protein
MDVSCGLARETGLSINSFPSLPYSKCAQMKRPNEIPYYSSDGTSRGFRSEEAARQLVADGFVQASYGRKGHLKAIWSRPQDGSSPVETQPPSGTRYSFPENLDSGRRCWKLRRLDWRDDNGAPVSTRGVCSQVLAECMVP